MEVSLLDWFDITDNCVYALSAEQTPPGTEASGARMAGYLDHVQGVVSAHDLSHLRYIITDGFYSKRTFLQGLCDLGLGQIGKLRLDMPICKSCRCFGVDAVQQSCKGELRGSVDGDKKISFPLAVRSSAMSMWK